MLVKAFSRSTIFLISLLVLGYFAYHYYDEETKALHEIGSYWWNSDNRPSTPSSQNGNSKTDSHDASRPSEKGSKPVDEHSTMDKSNHREVWSVSTSKGKYFAIDFKDYPAYNPNIIPHPTKHDTWIMVAQQEKSRVKEDINVFTELVCNAKFEKDRLVCTSKPVFLPVKPTVGGHCEGDLTWFNFNAGPHDARVFYGPEAPYIVYGSNSAFTCFGQWIQDFRTLGDDFGLEALTANFFKEGTELQRPEPYGKVEKNWFVFWDVHGQPYAHYDVAPKRSFAQLSADGSVGPDLAPAVADKDDACLAKYMPKLAEQLESIHQSTNSLLVTLCKRSDPSCHQTDSNTFIMTVFQHKRYYYFHSVYEPYVMLFKQSAPFELHSISQKPFWIGGRDQFTPKSGNNLWKGMEHPPDQSEMFYVTSLSWKAHGQKYHGYLDDVLFVTFGIEDSRPGGIDILAGDVLADLGVCAEL